jgi:hypothetical protein
MPQRTNPRVGPEEKILHLQQQIRVGLFAVSVFGGRDQGSDW